jgi:flagellar hook-length control protein FliK
MRTTIDPQLNLAATQVKSAKRTPTEGSSSFDDMLKAAKPQAKDQRAEQAKPDEPKKVEPKKKPEKPEAAEEAPPVEESEETTETAKPADATDESSGDASADDESTDEEGEKPVKTKDKDQPQVRQEDSVEIASLVAASPQPVQEAESVEAGSSEDSNKADVVNQSTRRPVPEQLKAQTPETASHESQTAEAIEGTEASTAPLHAKPAEDQKPETTDKVAGEEREPSTNPENAAENTKSSFSAPVADQSTAPAENAVTAASPPLHQVQASPVKTPEPQESQHASQAQDLRFAEDNHPRIVTGIRGELLPTGGKMTLKLDPPELGALQVQVHIQDGTMTATFQTTNDDATRLLSHSLATLKNSLESQGISVEKLQVQQAPRDQQTSTGQDQRESQQQNQWDNPSARQEQQRREMLQRMWRKLAGAEDPLDLVA